LGISVLTKLASALNRADEVLNQILAKAFATAGDKAAIRELVANLSNPDKAIQSDCIKVLYEVGTLQPDLIADDVDMFVALLDNRNNRLAAAKEIEGFDIAEHGASAYPECVFNGNDGTPKSLDSVGVPVCAPGAAGD
jgi:HEAT repeat protein